MKYLTILTSLLLINSNAGTPWDWPKFDNILNSLIPSNAIKTPTKTPPITNPVEQAKNVTKPIDNKNNTNTSGSNTTQNKADQYNVLSDFLGAYGANLGSIESPKVEKIEPATSRSRGGGIIGNIGGNVIQGYVDKNAPLVNDMMKNPDKQFDVSSLLTSPLSGVLDILSLASGINTTPVKQNQPKGKSVSQQVKDKGGKVTFYDLVDLTVDWLHDNKPFYNAVLDLAIAFLKAFPFFLDVVFRVIESVNTKFEPSLSQSVLNFLYNYDKHSTEKWTKLTDLIIIFLNKDLNVSQRALRDLFALLGNNKV